MRWLVDGYNVIRRSPELASAERRSLAEGRDALCRLLAAAARLSGDQFTVVFDGAGGGSVTGGHGGVRIVFSSARDDADRVLARLAGSAGAVVSSDRQVRAASTRAGATAIGAEEFLARLERGRASGRDAGPDEASDADEGQPGKDEEDEPARQRKGNPRRSSKKARAAARALGRLGPRP